MSSSTFTSESSLSSATTTASGSALTSQSSVTSTIESQYTEGAEYATTMEFHSRTFPCGPSTMYTRGIGADWDTASLIYACGLYEGNKNARESNGAVSHRGSWAKVVVLLLLICTFTL